MNRRTALTLVLACLAALLVGAPSASADDTSVRGRGAVERLWFDNQERRLVVRVFAPGGRCDIDSVTVKFRDRDGTKYKLAGTCVHRNPDQWTTRLSRGAHAVQCDEMRLVFKPSGGFWRGVVYRDCLRGLGNKVRVVSARVDTGSSVGKAGPTRYVARG
jgi:hypothetical protein